MTTLVDEDSDSTELTGRDTAPLVSILLAAMALLSFGIGAILVAGSSSTGTVFAWEFASPLTAALIGAGFLGAAPMMALSALRDAWEQARLAMLAGSLLVTTLFGVTVGHLGDTAAGGGEVLAYLMSLAWLLGLAALSVGSGVALIAQLREPALPSVRRFPLPRLVTPAVALIGSAGLGLGAALVVEPGWWAPILPWDLSTLDARAFGAWCLVLGVALMIALVEDDLDRLQPGLVGVLGIGVLALAVLGWHRDELGAAGWPLLSAFALPAALVGTGAIGLLLLSRARTREQAATG